MAIGDGKSAGNSLVSASTSRHLPAALLRGGLRFRRILLLGLLVAVVIHRNGRHVWAHAKHARIDHLVVNRARIGGAADSTRLIDGNIVAPRDLKTERRHYLAAFGIHRLGRHPQRQKPFDGMQPEGRLVAMVLEAPRKYAN